MAWQSTICLSHSKQSTLFEMSGYTGRFFSEADVFHDKQGLTHHAAVKMSTLLSVHQDHLKILVRASFNPKEGAKSEQDLIFVYSEGQTPTLTTDAYIL